MRIETLYHWSPAARRESILRDGLKVNADPVVSSARASYLCFSTCPRRAWCLSGAAMLLDESGWDLWQVYPQDHYNVELLSQWGCVVAEVRLRNDVPPGGCWLVGNRNSLVMGP